VISKKFELILSNNLNGNWTDYKSAIRKLSKKELLDFIEFCKEQGMKYYQIIKGLRIALN